MRFAPRAWVWIGCAIACALPTTGIEQPYNLATFRSVRAAEDDPLIRVTAVVTDQRGRLFRGLKPADFEILVDGKPEEVDVVELTTAATLPRAFAFLLDEFHTAATDSAAIRETLLRFVDHQLKPTDVALVVKPLDSLSGIKLTVERAALRQAISTFEGRKGDYAPRTAFERNYMAQAPAAVAHARGQIVTSALRAIGLTLSQTADVTPAIVFVSDGFERMRTGRDVPANLQSAVRIVNRAGAPVYAFAGTAPAASGDNQAEEPGIHALRALSADTGGDLVIGASGLESGLTRMMRDLETHYVLTYKASHGRDGKFHALKIAVKREGAQVRARSGYVAPMSAEMRAALTPAPAPSTRVLRRSSLIQSWYGMTPTEPGRAAVTLTWEPVITRLGVLPTARQASTIVLTAATTDGTVLFDGPVAPATDAGRPNIPNRATFEAPAGRVLVDIRILDAKGIVLDTDARDVAVPSARTDSPTVYPPEVIRTRSAREFREAVVKATAAPIAARDFRRTDRLLFRVPALDASGSPVPVTAELLNRRRQPMRRLSSVDDPSASSGPQLFDLPLAALAPGEYTVRFTVTYSGGSISEHVTFRVGG